MEPKLPVPSSPEAGAFNQQVLPPKPEVLLQSAAVEAAPERPAQQELQPAGPAQSAPALPAPAPMPAQPVAQTVPPLRPLTPADDNPAVASDEEVIEKEWVDKAKKIISDTKDDPYRQEKEVSKLQADYLKKRYGKDIKIVND